MLKSRLLQIISLAWQTAAGLNVSWSVRWREPLDTAGRFLS